MTAISKVLTVIADTQIDPDSPIDTALMTSIRDNLVFLKEWIGASYAAGAVQDHNHDGVNSALVPIGPNYLRNGSFEGGTAGWTLTQYTGGTAASSATNLNGANSLAITSTVLANGGGDAVSNEYTPVTGGANYDLKGEVMASGINVSCKAEIIWYDAAKAQISATTAYSSSSTPTVLTRIGGNFAAPATARFMRQKLTGGVPATGTAVGTVYFDGFVSATGGGKLIKFSIITASNASWAKQADTTQIVVMAIGGGGGSDGGVAFEVFTCKAGKKGNTAYGYTNAPASTYNVQIGAGGIGVIGGTGTSGGTSSFGALVSAAGGQVGSKSAVNGISLCGEGCLNGSLDSVVVSSGISAAANTGGGATGAQNDGTIGGSIAGGSGGSGVIFVWEYA